MSLEQPHAILPEPGPHDPIVVRRPRIGALSWILVGIGVGVGLTVLWESTGPPPPKVVDLRGGAVAATPTASSVAIPTPSASPTTPSSSPAPPFAPIPELDNLNFLPPILGGPELSPTVPSLPGNMPSLPMVGPGGNIPVQPILEGNAVTPAEVALVTMEATGDEAAGKIASLAKRLGGSAVKYSELAEKADADRPVILLLVPASKQEVAAAELKKIGASVDETWQGAPSDRTVQLDEKLAQAVRNLQRDRVKLTEKYFEDAEPVKELDERLAFATKQLHLVRIGGAPKSAVFRIYLGS